MSFYDQNKGKAVFTNFDGGLTNKTEIMEVCGKKYIVKTYRNLVDNFEVQNIEVYKKFDVPTIELDAQRKIMLYIDGKTFENGAKFSQENLIKVATKIKQLHASNLVSKNTFNPFEQLVKYSSKVKEWRFDISKYQEIINDTKVQWNDAAKVFCHNDLVAGNILFANSLYLIDWEYSGMNDPLFDVASFINENNLEGTNAASIFIDWYLDGSYPDKRNAINMYLKFMNVLWATWANMMFDNTGDKKFLEIMNIKLKK